MSENTDGQPATTPQVPPADNGQAGTTTTESTADAAGAGSAPAEGLAQPVAVPQLGSVEAAQADLAANPGRTASLSEAGYVVRD